MTKAPPSRNNCVLLLLDPSPHVCAQLLHLKDLVATAAPKKTRTVGPGTDHPNILLSKKNGIGQEPFIPESTLW